MHYLRVTGPTRRVRSIPAPPWSATVSRKEAPLYYDLIAEFDKITGVPIIINTSFNVRGEPIVCTPADAYLCFMRTNMDHLVLGHHVLDKKEQPPLREDVDWRSLYELD